MTEEKDRLVVTITGPNTHPWFKEQRLSQLGIYADDVIINKRRVKTRDEK